MNDMDGGNKPGPTGEFPDGKLNEDDDGGLIIKMQVSKENQVLMIEFGTNVTWIGLTKKDALNFAWNILSKAKELDD